MFHMSATLAVIHTYIHTHARSYMHEVKIDFENDCSNAAAHEHIITLTNTYTRARTHTHTHIHLNTHTHTHTHTHTT